jgi:signal transduction histidine kinase
VRQAIEDIELETDNLRGIITDLRPSLLDDLGLLPAIESLIDRRRLAGLEIETDLALPNPSEPAQLSPELETTIYRLVQESLTNIVKHAEAARVFLSIAIDKGEVVVEITDDGVGFDPVARTSGFGLAGMRERIYLAGGKLALESGEAGTTVRARIPVTPASVPEQTAR